MADYIDTAELANHIPEITVNAANQGLGYLAKNLNMAANVRKDFGSDFARKGDTLNIPKRGSLSVNDKTAGNQYTFQSPDDDVVQVVLNKHKEVSFLIEDAARAESIEGITEAYARDAALVLAEEIEQDLVDLYASAGTTLTFSDFSDWPEALREARRVLVTNKLPKLSPKFAQMDEYAYKTLLDTNVIEDASQYGSDEAAKEARVQRLSGIGLFESQVVGIDNSTSPDTYYPLVYGPDAVALAVRPLPEDGDGLGASISSVVDPRIGLSLRSIASYQHKDGGIAMTLDILYGVKVIRPEHLVAISHQPSVDTPSS